MKLKNSVFRLNPLRIILILGFAFLSARYMQVSDESNWVFAGRKYSEAILQMSPAKTYIPEVSHRLGVSVLWISGFIHIVFGRIFPDNILIIHRFVFILLNLLLLLTIVKLLNKHLQGKYIYLLIFYMFLNRYFSIMGKSTWLDQLLVSFGVLGTLFWLEYLEQRSKLKVLFSGFFNGLALLTKYAGWFFPPLLIFLSIFFCLKYKKNFRSFVLPLFLIISISLGIFVLFYPIMWVDPGKGLLMRFEDTRFGVKKIIDIWYYLKEIRYLDPVLILGSIFIVADLKKVQSRYLLLFGLSGSLYLTFFMLIFVTLGILGRLNYPFLEGIYRYTIPAIPSLALYTFARGDYYIKNLYIRWFLFGALFLRELVLSPIINL